MGAHSAVHVKRCYRGGQSGVVWFAASTLYRYDVRKGDLFVLSCARVRHCALVSVASVVFIVGAAVCSRFLIVEVGRDCCGVDVLFDVTFLCILMCMVYLLSLNAVCFLGLGVVCFVSECVGCCDFCLICDACSCECAGVVLVFRRASVVCLSLACSLLQCVVLCFVLSVVFVCLYWMRWVTIWWKRTQVWVLLWLCMCRVSFPCVCST